MCSPTRQPTRCSSREQEDHSIWIFCIQVIGGNKSLCPAKETVAANSMHGTPFLAFKLRFCHHNGNLNRGSFRGSARRRQFESKNQIAPASLTDYTTHGGTKKGLFVSYKSLIASCYQALAGLFGGHEKRLARLSLRNAAES